MIGPVAADAIRKVTGAALAVALTLLIFRVLSRAAAGTETLSDPAIYGALALGTLGVLWVKAAKRVRRGPPPPDAPPGPPPEGQ